VTIGSNRLSGQRTNLPWRGRRHRKDKLTCHTRRNDLDALQHATTTVLDRMEACFDSPHDQASPELMRVCLVFVG
jgi:hypothetical protein